MTSPLSFNDLAAMMGHLPSCESPAGPLFPSGHPRSSLDPKVRSAFLMLEFAPFVEAQKKAVELYLGLDPEMHARAVSLFPLEEEAVRAFAGLFERSKYAVEGALTVALLAQALHEVEGAPVASKARILLDGMGRVVAMLMGGPTSDQEKAFVMLKAPRGSKRKTGGFVPKHSRKHPRRTVFH